MDASIGGLERERAAACATRTTSGLDVRELDPERGTAADLAVDADGAADRLDEALGERESETGPFDARGLGVESVEGREESIDAGRG